MRGDRAADAGGEPAESEGQRLVAVETNAIGARRDIVVADRAQGAAEMRARAAAPAERQQIATIARRQPVDAAGAVDIVAEERQRRNAGHAHRARAVRPSQFRITRLTISPIAKRRDRDVVAAQPERRKDQRRAERAVISPAAGTDSQAGAPRSTASSADA